MQAVFTHSDAEAVTRSAGVIKSKGSQEGGGKRETRTMVMNIKSIEQQL